MMVGSATLPEDPEISANAIHFYRRWMLRLEKFHSNPPTPGDSKIFANATYFHQQSFLYLMQAHSSLPVREDSGISASAICLS